MIKQKIVYLDFDGKKVTEEHYFNMSPIEATRFQGKYGGDLQKYLESIGVKDGKATNVDPQKLVDLVEDVILSAYGVRSEDGRKFIKNDEVREDFKGTLAYDQLVLDIISDGDVATKFMGSIITTPKEK